MAAEVFTGVAPCCQDLRIRRRSEHSEVILALQGSSNGRKQCRCAGDDRSTESVAHPQETGP